jgi:hypothetical protein
MKNGGAGSKKIRVRKGSIEQIAKKGAERDFR